MSAVPPSFFPPPPPPALGARAKNMLLHDAAALVALHGLLASGSPAPASEEVAERLVQHAGKIADAFMANRRAAA